MGGTPKVLKNYTWHIYIWHWLCPSLIQLTSLISLLVEVGLSEVEDMLEVRRSFGLCLTTSLLLTNRPPGSLTSEEDLMVNRDGSPPECVRLLEGEWLTADLVESDEPASVLCKVMEGEECWRMCRDRIGDALGLAWGLGCGLAFGLAFGLTLGLDVGVALLPIRDGWYHIYVFVCECVCVGGGHNALSHY